MPAVSVDTFFACALMVILVVSAMAATSKILYPHINSVVDDNVAERYREISKYLLLSTGTPSEWGQNDQIIPETFGLAKIGSLNSYELDIDKVSRLNSENIYAVSYAQIFTALKMSDVSFRMEIKPLFEVTISLTEAFEEANETVYQFAVATQKHGVQITSDLVCYVIAEKHLEKTYARASDGRTSLNITLSNNTTGPVLLVVFAKASSNSKIISFNTYSFAHNSAEPQPKGTFLRLSPLNYSLNAFLHYSEMNLSNAYALTFNYDSTLTQISQSNNYVTYGIPQFLDSSPALLILTGWNSINFFAEWVAYPQIPIQIGANFAASRTLSNVYVNTYVVMVGSTLYECTIWLGGPR